MNQQNNNIRSHDIEEESWDLEEENLCYVQKTTQKVEDVYTLGRLQREIEGLENAVEQITYALSEEGQAKAREKLDEYTDQLEKYKSMEEKLQTTVNLKRTKNKHRADRKKKPTKAQKEAEK